MTHKGHSCRSNADHRHRRIANADLAGFYNLGDVILLPIMAICTNCSTIPSKAFDNHPAIEIGDAALIDARDNYRSPHKIVGGFA